MSLFESQRRERSECAMSARSTLSGQSRQSARSPHTVPQPQNERMRKKKPQPFQSPTLTSDSVYAPIPEPAPSTAPPPLVLVPAATSSPAPALRVECGRIKKSSDGLRRRKPIISSRRLRSTRTLAKVHPNGDAVIPCEEECHDDHHFQASQDSLDTNPLTSSQEQVQISDFYKARCTAINPTRTASSCHLYPNIASHSHFDTYAHE